MKPIPVAALALALLASACMKAAGDDAPVGSDRTSPPDQQAPAQRVGFDTATDPVLRRIEREALALAKTEGCTTADQCRTAPVGNRPCGGPRFYVAYCKATTDSAALYRKLDELSRAEGETNRKSGAVSTCEFRMPPELEVVGGSCRVKIPSGG
jgi:hypothetical protein